MATVTKVPFCYKSALYCYKSALLLQKCPIECYKSAPIRLQKCPGLQKFPTLVSVVFRLLRHFVPHTWCNVGSSCISGSGKAWRVLKVVCSELKHFKRFNPC